MCRTSRRTSTSRKRRSRRRSRESLRHRPRLGAHRLRLRRDRRVAPPRRHLRRHHRSRAGLVPREAPADSRPPVGAPRTVPARLAGHGDLPRALGAARARRPCGRAAQQGDELAHLSPVIALLRGRLLEKHPNRIIIDVGGVGYDVFVPLSTFYSLGEAGAPGDEVALRIHPHVRQDALVMYGFATRLEQDHFERLISVSGIGPKVGLAVLSGIEPVELIRAIERGDLARLTAIPGVGKKTAERIVLELKDRLPRAAPAPAAPGADTPSAPSHMRVALLSPLTNLGDHRPPAEKAADSAIKAVPDGVFERVLKQALREL